jgi:hypothetical protein
MAKTRFEISCENFDLFFDHEMGKISPSAKAELPKDVGFKLFRGGGKLNTKSTSKLPLVAKLYILWKCLNKRFWIMVEDDDEGMSTGQFMELRKAYKKKDYSIDQVNVLKSYGEFVLSSGELADSMTYLNRLSGSGAYNYALKGKNSVKNRVTEDFKERAYLARFLTNYDSQKKNIISSTGLTVPEFYVLLSLYEGKEVPTSHLSKEKFKRAYQSTPSKIKLAFGTLQSKGLVVKNGVIKGATLQITSSGKELLNSMFEKYILNC